MSWLRLKRQIAKVKVFVALTGKDWGTGKDHSILLHSVAKIRPFLLARCLKIFEWKERGYPCCCNFFLYFTNWRISAMVPFRNCIHLSDHLRFRSLRTVGPPRFLSSLDWCNPKWTPWLPCSIYGIYSGIKRRRISFLEMTFARCWKFGPTNFSFYHLSNSLGNGTQFGCSCNINGLELHSCSCIVTWCVCAPQDSVKEDKEFLVSCKCISK